MYPLAHVGLARSLVAQGRLEEARREFDAFLELWSAADREIPMLRAAHAERARIDVGTR
jgi:hypothetical protein